MVLQLPAGVNLVGSELLRSRGKLGLGDARDEEAGRLLHEPAPRDGEEEAADGGRGRGGAVEERCTSGIGGDSYRGVE